MNFERINIILRYFKVFKIKIEKIPSRNPEGVILFFTNVFGNFLDWIWTIRNQYYFIIVYMIILSFVFIIKSYTFQLLS